MPSYMKKLSVTERDLGPINEDIKCFCDIHCTVFQDCCTDYEQTCLPVAIVHGNSSRSLDIELWACNHGGNVQGAKGVWMIAACPAKWTQDEIAINCTGNVRHLSEGCRDFAPVIDETGNTYKNRFCALCNGVQANTSRFYDIQLVQLVSNARYNTSGAMLMNCSGEYVVIADADSTVYINRTGKLISKIDYWSNQTETNNGSMIPVGDILVCRKALEFSCSGTFIHLKDNEYVILSNRSLYKNGSNMIYDFMLIDGKAAICVSVSSDSVKANVALAVISYVGIGLSIACLVLVLITYLLFKELRSLPGVNLMNLCLSLLIAHSLFMTAGGATHNRLVCTSVAVLLHYFYLSSFIWMSLIAFDTYRTFSRTCHTRQRTGKLKTRFLALGWLPALLFVVICFSLDQSGLVAIGYGGTDHCWINNVKSNTFVFVIPVAFSILFNALFFLLTVNSIRKIKKQTQQVAKAANSRRNMVLFLKLAILMDSRGFSAI
ncbi:hypothetical protein OS493_032983 [Desmophyllum pertusum]|uniref:G-protein coupled receptors family 2 profile 2 domain-containing protein n=1 Tax=Desmophyllum pertusum TaxID=174260 RepID=A0A9W9ZXX2_9CNID|nr:hypothetical protein OS493_032983 [Desmophyllum pertusum]